MSLLKIGKKDFEVQNTEMNQFDLKFYPKNPRVFSLLNVAEEEPDQETILKKMVQMDHVKELKLAIESNGGLIDPLIICNNTVLEGNSRLAAYRILGAKNPVKWTKIKVSILPSDIDESSIFQLLGQYHIIGRKDWSPYEQAGYLYRRTQESKKPAQAIAEELGMNINEVKKYIEVFEYMKINADLEPTHWSYYVELLKNCAIRKYNKDNPSRDIFKNIAERIKNDEIKEASDIRKIGTIAKTEGKVARKALENFLAESETLEEAY